ncbi:MAG TPA: hypothetical protein VKC55_08945 [Actinomycetota bacterium]|jgi:hypothetical protein|nr:hypothetical protein [Actinomycetota bacterium]
MAERVLVTIELRFTTEDEPEQLGERVRESAALIVGKDALEDFRLRVLPLAPPKQPRSV